MTRRLAIFIHLLAVLTPGALAQQPDAPELTIEQAIREALRNNSSVIGAKLDIEKSVQDLAANRTKRFASMQLIALGGQLLTKPSVTFAQGSLGVYPTVGPIPATDQKIEVARRPALLVIGTISQPLTTLFKLNLQLKAQAFGLEATRQDQRKTRVQIADQVRRAYYEVAEAQSQLDSLLASLPYYRESKRLAEEKRKRETVLESEVLNADAQLIKTENSAAQAKDQLSTSSEKLNDLMGRDIHIQFRVSGVRETEADLDTLEALEARALKNRPDLEKARLQVRQAEYDSRAKKAEYIPEVSASFDYFTTGNLGNTLPANIAAVGLTLTWEPWDWGRKRHELAGKRVQEQQARVAVSSTERSILLDVRSAARQLEDGRRQVIQTEASQRASRQKLSETQDQFKRETVLPKDLFQAQSDLANADYQHGQALSAFWKARADLKKAIGEE